MKRKKITFIQGFKRFLKPVFDEKIISLKGLLPTIGGSVVGIILVFLLKEITNSISNGNIENISFLLTIFVGFLILFYIILIFTRQWTHSVMWPRYRGVVYKKFINKYIHLDNNEIEKVGTGKLIAMLDKGLFSWVEILVVGFVSILPNIVFILFSFVFIAFINIYYFLVVITIFILILFLTYVTQAKAKPYRDIRRDLNIGITKKFVTILMSKFEILQNKKVDQEVDYIKTELGKNIKMNFHINNMNIITDMSVRFLIDGSKVAIILLFAFGYGKDVINIGEFVSLMSIIYILDQMLTSLTDNYKTYTKTFVNVDKVWEFFDTTKSIKGYEKGKKFEYKKGNIEIKDLSYGYTKKTLVFDKLNLKIKGGNVTALVGNSGSGKSTLVKLIAGYIHTNKGSLLVDKQEINKIALKTYYKSVGYLTQDPSVFDGSIIENLTYSVERDLEDGELEKILKLAKCEFIYELKDGVNTEIGERGVRLSGGQKQRLAIAKIFLKDPKIIILDEPTSALDSFSEEQITKAMHNLFKGRTVIIIAHRLQTVKNADEILLFENGKIKERGTHKELIKLKGDYKKMLDLQSGI